MVWLKFDKAPIFIDTLANRRQKAIPNAEGYASDYEKPRGFWITDDSEDNWLAWCLSQRFGLDGLTHRHEIDLHEVHILILRSICEVVAFANQYKFECWWGPPNHPHKFLNRCIDWPQVARDYSGIIITPYQWKLRLEDGFSWYYGWDCASGCIWDVQAIKDIRLVEIDHNIADKARPEWNSDEAAA